MLLALLDGDGLIIVIHAKIKKPNRVWLGFGFKLTKESGN